MPESPQPKIDWQHWIQRWDVQQMGYLPHREARFSAMFDVLEVLLPPDFVAIDLACGPGSLSQRLLQRFPQAQCIAIDFDPVLLAMGQANLGNSNGRLQWLEADLMVLDLATQYTQIDAVLSTTALHWLPVTRLIEIYQQLGKCIRPGGIFLNGDNIPFSPRLEKFQQVSKIMNQRHEQRSFQEQDIEDWGKWWTAIAQESSINELIKERHHRFSHRPVEVEPIYEIHHAALENAGFSEVGTIWQERDDRIIMAVR